MRNHRFVASAVQWLTTGPRVVPILAIAGIFVAFGLLAFDYFSHFESRVAALSPEDDKFRDFLFPYLRRFYLIALALLVPAFVMSLVRRRGKKSWVLPLFLASLAILVAWLPGELIHSLPNLSSGRIGEEPALKASYFNVVLIILLILSPPVVARCYERSSILSRFVLRSFLLPFAMCLFGFFAIWLIIDLSNYGPDFVSADTSFAEVGYLYVVQLPQIFLLVVPIAILLSLLYSLGKMSGTNELVSMIGCGRSVAQILSPLFAVGLYATFIALVLNYQWAPRSTGLKEEVLEQIKQGFERQTLTVNHLHYNNIDRRSWYIGFIPFDMAVTPMSIVEIRQQDDQGRLRRTYYAATAKWDYRTRKWTFVQVSIYHYDETGIPRKIDQLQTLEITDWRETPFKLVSSSFNPEFLGIPRLTSFLKTNREYEERQLAPFRAHWHYRWAMPWTCFVCTLVAAPLGIVFSRRGLLGSVASAIFIFFTMMFLEQLFLALGMGGHLPAVVAAWANNFIFAAVGGVLLYYRTQNRSLPSLSLNFFKKRPPAPAVPEAT